MKYILCDRILELQKYKVNRMKVKILELQKYRDKQDGNEIYLVVEY